MELIVQHLAELPETFADIRKSLFLLAHAFANLPESVQEGLSRPEAMYSFGWSHGKEVMNGVSSACCDLLTKH